MVALSCNRSTGCQTQFCNPQKLWQPKFSKFGIKTSAGSGSDANRKGCSRGHSFFSEFPPPVFLAPIVHSEPRALPPAVPRRRAAMDPEHWRHQSAPRNRQRSLKAGTVVRVRPSVELTRGGTHCNICMSQCLVRSHRNRKVALGMSHYKCC